MPDSAAQVGRRRRLRTLRELVGTLREAATLVRRADPAGARVVVALQLVSVALLAVQVLVGRLALQAVLDADRGDAGVGDAALPLLALAAAGAVTSLTGPMLLQYQRLLADQVQRRTYDQVLDVTASVDLEAFESPEFFDRLERVQANALPRPLQVTQALTSLVGGVLGVLALAGALLALEPLLVPLLLLAGLPVLALTRRSGGTEFAFAVGQTATRRLREYLRDLLTGRDEAKEVRAFHAQALLRRRYDALWDVYLLALRAQVRRRLRLALLSTLVLTITTAVTLVGLLLLVVEDRIGLAEAGAAAIAVRLLAGRLELVVASLGTLFESALFLRDLRGFLALRVDRPEGPPLPEEPADAPVLRAVGVRYRYPSGDADVVDGVDLELRRGEVVALVGENGSGKTTLVKLLAGLYHPTSGTVLRGTTDARDLDPAELARRTVVVFQDFVRYTLTAHDNIALGVREGLDDVVRSARAADADRFLAALPRGYDTVLSAEHAGGTDLSGGQWQRVALARALHREAPLVLLDEPSAALDPRSEQRLFETLRGLLHDRAVVLVSHRFSTVRSADRILVMAAGRIVEQGTHEELVEQAGRYAELYALQESGYRRAQPGRAGGGPDPSEAATFSGR